MKKYDESIRVLNKTIELDSNSADAYVLKGKLLCLNIIISYIRY